MWTADEVRAGSAVNIRRGADMELACFHQEPEVCRFVHAVKEVNIEKPLHKLIPYVYTWITITEPIVSLSSHPSITRFVWANMLSRGTLMLKCPRELGNWYRLRYRFMSNMKF
jgi:hypothetical protein